MTPPALHTELLVLARAPAAGRYAHLTVFTPEHGRLLVLDPVREPGKRSGPVRQQPDLFDHAGALLAPGRAAGTYFLREYHLLRRHNGVATSLDALRWASRLACLLDRNLRHIESFAWLFALSLQTFQAMAGLPHPAAAYLKALFRFARNEGYGVEAGWLAALPAPDRTAATAILTTPLETLDAAVAVSAGDLVASLERFLAEHADLLLPKDGAGAPS
jgi:hypothetical protein